ncbi:MAG: disulfide bond formation protein B [Oligoflexia bacterium]|nr:disulfide bond formation protein B [Oligoflexia bacterium]
MNDSLKLKLSFLVALAGFVGSLFFSELMKLPPCSLCWYQRIALYPLVTVFGAAIWFEDGAHRRYSVPLIALGLLLSGYHNLLYYGVIPEGITPCSQGVPCTSRQLELLGFVTIPLLSLLGFVTLGALNFRFKSGEMK